MKLLAAAAVMMMMCANVNAQEKSENKGQNWKSKIQSEKIAFITRALDLSPEEAQAFWPVYNKISKQKNEAQANIRTAYRELKVAVKEGNDAASALDKYTKAMDNNKVSEVDNAKALKKVLPAEKVAKLYIAEENFRKAQINKMNQAAQQAHMGQGFRPGSQQQGHFQGRPQNGQFKHQGKPQGDCKAEAKAEEAK